MYGWICAAWRCHNVSSPAVGAPLLLCGHATASWCTLVSPSHPRRFSSLNLLNLSEFGLHTPGRATNRLWSALPCVCIASCRYPHSRKPPNHPLLRPASLHAEATPANPYNNKTPAVATARPLCAPPCVCPALSVNRRTTPCFGSLRQTQASTPRSPYYNKTPTGHRPPLVCTAVCVHRLVYVPPGVCTALLMNHQTTRCFGSHFRGCTPTSSKVTRNNGWFGGSYARRYIHKAVYTQGVTMVHISSGRWPPQESCYLRGV